MSGIYELCRLTAAQGAVLLKNEEQVLPLVKQEIAAVFGRAQIDYYRSGTGSGGAVNAPYTTNLLESLRKQANIGILESLAQVYEKWIAEHPFDNGGGGWAAEPWSQEEMPVTKELAQGAAANADKALVVIGRTAGEEKDNLAEPGSYFLTETEKAMIKTVSKYFDKTILIFNVGNIIDMSFLQESGYENVKGILYVWHGGIEGGNGAADVICGRVTPGGKLTDTIADSLETYPSHENHGGELRNIYREDIYVGYRYFETFAPGKVLYPFGFGLSYTGFAIVAKSAVIQGQAKEATLCVEVEVRNSGNKYEGKEVVQIYMEAPQGRLGRPVRELAAFQKTPLLAPGEAARFEVRVPLRELAAYDETGASGYSSSYVLEAGAYRFYLGNSVRDAEALVIDGHPEYYIEETILVEKCREAMAPVSAFHRLKPGSRNFEGVYQKDREQVPLKKIDLAKRIKEELPGELVITGDKGLTLQDVKEGRAGMEAFLAQLTKEDLAAIVRGEGMCSPKVTAGTASAFGGVTDRLLYYGIPVGCCADGPSGVRMDNGSFATQLPIGTLLACTWDVELVELLFDMLRRELEENKVDILLGPGTNIHRHPLNGRNFEYFSEDPLLSGSFAAAVTRGIDKGRTAGAVKHFSCNSQEKNRSLVESVVSERALREIYLRPFELAIKKGGARAIMTSYNPVNGHWSASNYDMNTTILRKEWGFTGLVMTDWWAKMNDCITGGEASLRKTGDMVRSQNDVYMVVSNNGAEVNAMEDDTLSALEEGRLTIGELQRSASNICRFLMNTHAADRIKEMKKEIEMFSSAKKPEASGVQYIEESAGDMLELADRDEIWFKVSAEGIYDVTARLMSPMNNLAQTVCQATLNGKVMCTFQTNGTEGRWIVQKLIRIRLEEGWYHMKLDFVKPGMQVESMRFLLSDMQ